MHDALVVLFDVLHDKPRIDQLGTMAIFLKVLMVVLPMDGNPRKCLLDGHV